MFDLGGQFGFLGLHLPSTREENLLLCVNFIDIVLLCLLMGISVLAPSTPRRHTRLFSFSTHTLAHVYLLKATRRANAGPFLKMAVQEVENAPALLCVSIREFVFLRRVTDVFSKYETVNT